MSHIDLRDWFAGKALRFYHYDTSRRSMGVIARDCYDLADALMAERALRCKSKQSSSEDQPGITVQEAAHDLAPGDHKFYGGQIEGR